MLELLERIPFPRQLDRIVIFTGIVAGAVLTPIAVVLIALLIFDELTAAEVVFWLAATLSSSARSARCCCPTSCTPRSRS